MKNKDFRFKTFTVTQDRAAMKVNTDGVLLGAWVGVCDAQHVLDIGTGTGVIALMIASRNSGVNVTGVEIDNGSFLDAESNRLQNEFSDRLEFFNMSFQEFSESTDQQFDHIVSNPPYFVDGTLSSDTRKANTRHTTGLSFGELISHSLALLKPHGKLSVILPNIEGDMFIKEANRHKLHIQKKCYVNVKEGKLGRFLLTFSRAHLEAKIEHLTIRMSDGSFSPEYVNLTREFYLKF